jgi:hypothetical protein
MQSHTITIFDTTIRQDADGRFCLNDLHKAAMANGQAQKDHNPARFLRNDGIKEFVSLLDNNGVTDLIKIIKGRGITGTYASKEIAIQYMKWIAGPKMEVLIVSKITELDEIIEALTSFEVPDDLPDMYVYAIRETETGRIKLGISKDPENRLKQLQIGNSQALELVAYRKAENRYKDELAVHIANDPLRIRGEWFDAGVVI